MKKKATLKDVSQLAGVSSATVSYVLNNKEQKISQETRERVLDAVKQLNYIPNHSAKSLFSNLTRCIGVVMDKDITIPRYAQTLQGIRHVLSQNGYRILLSSAKTLEGKNIPDYLDNYFSNLVDGLIYIGGDSKPIDAASLNLLIQYSVPVVVFNCTGLRRISAVEMDYYTGALDMIRQLHESDIQKVFYLRPELDIEMERERELGTVRGCAICNMELKICPLVFPYSGANMQLFQVAFSERERVEFRQFVQAVQRQVNAVLDQLDEHTAVVCSWAGMEQLVYPLVSGKHVTIAVLAQGLLYPGAYPEVRYSYLPNYEAGNECARMVLKLMKDPTQVYREVLTPTVRLEEV